MKNTILVFLYFALLCLCAMFFEEKCQGATEIPRERHFLCKIDNGKWPWSKKKETFSVELKVKNDRKQPIAVKAVAQEVTFEHGKLKLLDNYIPVEPERVTLYNDRFVTFNIQFPVKKEDGSTLVIFSCSPDTGTLPGGGGRVVSSTGTFIGVSFYKKEWMPEPTFTVKRENGQVIVTLGNKGKVMYEATLRFQKGGEYTDDKAHLFIPSQVTREFVLPDNFDAVVLDIGGFDKLLGRRVR